MTTICIPACPERKAAMQAGEMFWDTVQKRWKFPVTAKTFASWADVTDYHWTFCPFCGDELCEPLAEWYGEDGG